MTDFEKALLEELRLLRQSAEAQELIAAQWLLHSTRRPTIAGEVTSLVRERADGITETLLKEMDGLETSGLTV